MYPAGTVCVADGARGVYMLSACDFSFSLGVRDTTWPVAGVPGTLWPGVPGCLLQN